MAIGVIFNFPGGTTEQYDQVCRGLNNGQPMRSLADSPGGGCLSHTAGATPDGLCVLDVWESPEKFQAFGQQLMPLAQQAGLEPDEPVILPAQLRQPVDRGRTAGRPRLSAPARGGSHHD